MSLFVVILRATRSQLNELCGQKAAPEIYLYRADFLPTQLDQMTPSAPYFSFID